MERYQTLLDINELYTIGQRKEVIRAKKQGWKTEEYKPLTTNIAMQWEWNIDAQGVYTFVMTSFVDGGGKIEITVNPDESGTLEFYEEVSDNYALTLKVVWQSDGSGQWWTYENGTETDSGGWS